MMLHRVRVGLLPLVDQALAGHSPYTAYTLDESEHVMTQWEEDGVQGARDLLWRLGYSYNVMGAAKYHWETGRVDDGSYRLIDEDNPDWQWHVHIFHLGEGVVDYASHYELRWEPWAPTWNVGRSREHYRPTYGQTYIQGAASPGLQELADG